MPFIYADAPARNSVVNDIKRGHQEAALWARANSSSRSSSSFKPTSLVAEMDGRARQYVSGYVSSQKAAPSSPRGARSSARYEQRAMDDSRYAVDPYAIVYADPHPVPQIAAQPAQMYPPPGFPLHTQAQVSDYNYAFSPSNPYTLPPAPRMSTRNDNEYGRPVLSPHGTHHYPQAKVEPVYEEPHTIEAINDAFARWYVDEVVNLLVKPGQYREGTGGQSLDIWGEQGRARDCYERVGLPVPVSLTDVAPYGRLDPTIGRTVRNPHGRAPHAGNRRPEWETQDPFLVARRGGGRSEYLVSFVVEILGRMAISPTAVVNAMWFLRGLAFHQLDGAQGFKLRSLLYDQQYEDRDAVTKRVATLGLILAGKWLDDNSFLTKSWHEVTHLPIDTINQLERAALEEFQYSLFVPLSDWVDHVCGALSDINQRYTFDACDAVVACHLDRMALDAREAEIYIGAPQADDFDMVRRLSVVDTPAADQAIQREWNQYAQTYSIAAEAESMRRSFAVPPVDTGLEEITSDIEAERNVAALVDDEWMNGDDEEDEYDFVEYDGAKPWLPSASELKRSQSNSSAMSLESMQQWRSATHHANSSVSSVEHVIFDSANHAETSDHSFDHPDCVECRFYAGPNAVPTNRPIDSFDLEPGISIVSSPNSSFARRDVGSTGPRANYGLDAKVDPSFGHPAAEYGASPQTYTSHSHKHAAYTGTTADPYNFCYTPASFPNPFRE